MVSSMAFSSRKSSQWTHPKTGGPKPVPHNRKGMHNKRGSGRFYGAIPSVGIIQESRDSGNDGGVSKIENIPVEMHRFGRDVAKYKISHSRMDKPVDPSSH